MDPAELAGRLRLAVARLARVLRQQDESGLSPTLTVALATVAREGPVTLGELAAFERVAPPSITKVVAKLEARELVTRTVDPHDKRVYRVAITPAGQRQLDQNRTRRAAWLATRLAQLETPDIERLAAAAGVLEALTAEGGDGAATGGGDGDASTAVADVDRRPGGSASRSSPSARS